MILKKKKLNKQTTKKLIEKEIKFVVTKGGKQGKWELDE